MTSVVLAESQSTCSEDIDEFANQEYIGETLLEKSAAELDRKLNLPDGPRERLVKHIKKLKAAAAARLHTLPLLPGSRSLGAS